MTKIAIKILNLEHGQKVKDYFESLGATNSNNYTFNSIGEYYYFNDFTKLIDLTSGVEDQNEVENKSSFKIITLPEEKTFPREMLVSHDGNFKKSQKRIVLCKLEYNNTYVYIAVYSGFEDNFKRGEWFETTCWKYAKELPEEPVKTPLQLEFEELQLKIKELQIKADETKTKL